MSLDHVRKQSFRPHAIQEWTEKAEESLNGKTLKSLQSLTYEDIRLRPLYTREDEKVGSEYQETSDFRRGLFPRDSITNGWKVAQRITYENIEDLKEQLHQAIKNGQSAISFHVTKTLFEKNKRLPDLLTDLYEKYPFAINAKGLQPAFLAEIIRMMEKEGKSEKVTGYIAHDPIALFVEEGLILKDYFKGWADDVITANNKLPNLQTVLINTSIYHQSGANAVQELGIAVATGIFYLQLLLESGMKLEEILSKMIFQFSIGSNFFMEVAKLRAARILWHKITEVYRAEPKLRGMQITAETSSFTKTLYDPHVNILRAGNEAFAAVIGGIQYLHVTPFDQVTGGSPLSERIARNTQNILSNEAHLQRVVDPAGGSWYVEELTTELASRAWEYFQQIEAKGGIVDVLISGTLQQEIKAVLGKRRQDIFIRKQNIVGTNRYANLSEKNAETNESPFQQFIVKANLRELLKEDCTSIDVFRELDHFDFKNEMKALSKTRLSEPFEDLRKRAEGIKGKSGFTPSVGMICLGELKQYKPRLDFMKGFLSAGGIEAVESVSISSLDTGRQFVSNQASKYFCLCGSNDQYETIGFELLAALTTEFPERIFLLAGLPAKEQQEKWINNGIKQFIHTTSNCYELLSSMLTEMEVSANEVAKT